MTDRDPHVAALLDEAAFAPAARSERWEAIVREAGRPRRRWLAAGIPTAACLAAAALLLTFAWPLGGERGGSVLQRALAAVGEGPVVHVVFSEGWGGTLVDLESGRRTKIHGEKEAWYDPELGLHEVMRFGGTLEYDVLYAPGKVPMSSQREYAGLGEGYVEALRAGRTAVAGKGQVDGVPVLWIKVHRELLPDVADGQLHELALEVAVSEETYAPVATRWARDGNPGPDGADRIEKLERVSVDDRNFVRMAPDLNGTGLMFTGIGGGTPLTAEAAATVLGRAPLWPGSTAGRLPLTRISKAEYASRARASTERWDERGEGVNLLYGAMGGGPTPAGRPIPEPYLAIAEATKRYPGFQRGVVNYVPSEGSVLLIGSHIAAMQKDGLQVSIEASDEELILEAARALEPMPASVGSAARR